MLFAINLSCAFSLHSPLIIRRIFFNTKIFCEQLVNPLQFISQHSGFGLCKEGRVHTQGRLGCSSRPPRPPPAPPRPPPAPGASPPPPPYGPGLCEDTCKHGSDGASHAPPTPRLVSRRRRARPSLAIIAAPRLLGRGLALQGRQPTRASGRALREVGRRVPFP